MNKLKLTNNTTITSHIYEEVEVYLTSPCLNCISILSDKATMVLSLKQAKLRKIVASVTSIFQERRLLQSWLSPRNQSRVRYMREATRRNETGTIRIENDRQLTNDSTSKQSRQMTLYKDNNKQTSLKVVSSVKDQVIPSRKRNYRNTIITLSASHLNKIEDNRKKRPMLISFSIVKTVKYRCERLF